MRDYSYEHVRTPAPWYMESGEIKAMKGEIAIHIAHADRNEPMTQPVERDENVYRIILLVNAFERFSNKQLQEIIDGKRQIITYLWE